MFLMVHPLPSSVSHVRETAPSRAVDDLCSLHGLLHCHCSPDSCSKPQRPQYLLNYKKYRFLSISRVMGVLNVTLYYIYIFRECLGFKTELKTQNSPSQTYCEPQTSLKPPINIFKFKHFVVCLVLYDLN